MMRRYPVGTPVPGGFYLDPLTGDTAIVPRGGGMLRGGGGSYIRLPIPAPLALFLVPLVGLLYVIVMPFVGLALLFGMLCRKAWAATGAREALGAVLGGVHGRPGWAFLLGGRRGVRGRARDSRSPGAGGAPEKGKAREDKR